MRTYIKLFTNDLKNKGLSLYDKAVFGSLVTKYQYHNNSEFYTYETFIADELEISESSVKRSIKKLTETGLISINKKYHKQLKQTVNYYTINLNAEDLISDTQNLEPNTAITQSQICEQKPNIEETEPIIEDNNIYKDIKWYNEISEVIEDEFNLTPEDYFNQFKDAYAFGFNRLEHISDKAKENGNKITPDDVLTFFDSIKELKVA
jgi:predicted transcriptional regulator